MSLLEDIRDAAVDADVSLAQVLRKAKTLAVRLGNEEFKTWVDHELNGYPSVDDLPDYRVKNAIAA